MDHHSIKKISFAINFYSSYYLFIIVVFHRSFVCSFYSSQQRNPPVVLLDRSIDYVYSRRFVDKRHAYNKNKSVFLSVLFLEIYF